METSLRVLYVGSTGNEGEPLVDEFRRKGYDVTHRHVDTPAALRHALDVESWDVVLIEYSSRHFAAFEALNAVKVHDWDLPVIVICSPADEGQAAAALQVGANDYVLKGRLLRLVPAVQRAAREAEAHQHNRSAEEALRRSEEQYRELVENANDVIFSADLQGNFTALNKAGEQISGYTREELTRMNMAQVLAPESLVLALEMIRVKLQDNQPTTYELTMIARDGHRVPLELSTRLIYHGDVPVGVQGIARDITERKKAAEALRESEARYRSLFENASDVVYTHDLRGNFTSVNTAGARITGYSQNEILQLNIAGIVAPEYLGLTRDMIRYKLAEGTPTTYEVEIVTKTGQRLTLEVNSRLMYREGMPTDIQGIARDVTERRRAEQELRAQARKQRVVAEVGQQALARTNLEALFDDAVSAVALTLDTGYCSILELSGDGALLESRAGVGWNTGIVGHESVGAGPESQAGYALLSSEPVVVADFSRETRFTVPSILKEHKVKSGMSAIIHGPSRPFGVLSVFSQQAHRFTADDVHFLQSVANVLATAIERRRLEEDRANHSKELATRVLQAQEAERKRIARELHDETAQSLSILLTNLDLLEDHIPPKSRVLRSGFERVGMLAKRTLDGTRAMSHDLRPTILDDAGLVAALQWVAAEYEDTFGGDVEVDAESPPPGRVTSELEVALFRIAQEALNNTGKHAGASRVRLSLFFSERSANLAVEDNGRGFDRAHVPGPTREGRLGLYGMHERAELLGGTLSVQTAPGRGTTIAVELPLGESPLEATSPVGVTRSGVVG